MTIITALIRLAGCKLACMAAGILALAFLPLQGSVELVAHKIAKEITGAETTALSTPGYNSSPGNLILVWAVSYSGFQPVGSVTDSAGDVFTPLTLNRGTWYGQWFYAKNVKGESFNVVTIHPAIKGRATMTYAGMNVLEYSGAHKTVPLAVDTAGKQGALDGLWESASFDVSAGELVLGGIVTANGGVFTAAPNLKIEDAYQSTSGSKFSFAAMDRIFLGAQSGITVRVSWKGTLQATGAVVSIKPEGP